MTQFLGTHQNRLDAKGRVSVPAPFRAALRALANGNGNGNGEGTGILVLRPSHKHDCIEAWPPAVFDQLAAPLDRLDVFSDAQDDLLAALYAEAYPVDIDREGRIVLPESLIAHARLNESVVFMGLGRTFQIWEPEGAQQRRMQAREHVRSHGLTLPAAARSSA